MIVELFPCWDTEKAPRSWWGSVEVDDDRGVVGRALALARLAVDVRVGDLPGQPRGRVEQIDSHAFVLVEHTGAIVPVGERVGPFQRPGYDVAQAEVEERRHSRALRTGDVRR